MDAMAMLQMMTSNLRFVDVDIKQVDVLHHAHKRSEKKQCFNNSYRYLVDHSSLDGKYVLGYVMLQGSLPVEHAWVEVKGKYFDVTLDPKPTDVYYVVTEIDQGLLHDIVSEESEAPDLYTLNKFLRNRKPE